MTNLPLGKLIFKIKSFSMIAIPVADEIAFLITRNESQIPSIVGSVGSPELRSIPTTCPSSISSWQAEMASKESSPEFLASVLGITSNESENALSPGLSLPLLDLVSRMCLEAER
ncbi:hypothetical protein OGAPHI_005478 [Ogataea philodendri]|uniref:Uncharacterized protein n=1 Tax=Ogataea philodendri TaxID=1378263 RepID=A0A9P8NZ93_9ASCO|nr:uncharacterized protein OGAPHI_005478 [Ogataea philodendri]KAH3662230.1 hypothetical protein OGAPHI_005478 [Ogataea philodendri]